MNWQNIRISNDNTYFQSGNTSLFDKVFIEVLKFHAPGIAAVKDESGAYHIDINGHAVYPERYARSFGYYCNRAAVIENDHWFHLNEKGEKLCQFDYSWTGNYQEDFCSVRDKNNYYFHIDLNGKKTYNENYVYCGDYKDGIACVRRQDGSYIHIDETGKPLNEKPFIDLGIFHKKFATARDFKGWHHIAKSGDQLYSERYLAVEPFYNGYALVTDFNLRKSIIDEEGFVVLQL